MSQNLLHRDDYEVKIVKLSAHRAELPGNVDMIAGSALTPVLESVTALPAYRAVHPADLPVKIPQ
jgi:hypothetical protein